MPRPYILPVLNSTPFAASFLGNGGAATVGPLVVIPPPHAWLGSVLDSFLCEPRQRVLRSFHSLLWLTCIPPYFCPALQVKSSLPQKQAAVSISGGHC